MRPNKLLSVLLLCAPLALGACGEGAPSNSNGAASVTSTPLPAATAPPGATPTPQAQVVTASADEATIEAGKAGEAVVRVEIARGYHVNANPASDRFYVPTELRVEAQEGFTPGRPVYPAGKTRKFGFSETPLSVYEGSVVIRLPLSADKAAAKGRHTLRAKVRVQPCNDEACLQPLNIDTPVNVTVN